MQDANRLTLFGRNDLDKMRQVAALPADWRIAMKAVAAVLPFKVNSYVVDNLIDWSAVPDDPIFQLTFPQPGMLEPADLDQMIALVRRDASAAELRCCADGIRRRLNPHPAGQIALNVPRMRGVPVPGVQHKYPDTVLLFPAAGQTCHSYCSYCFRWPQFVGLPGMKFAAREAGTFVGYVAEHQEVSSVLVTGGDPMIMSAAVLSRYVEPLLTAQLSHVSTIRIGTKALAFWPQRFLTDPDADDILRLFERVVSSGRSLALMAHSSHARELSTPQAREAVARVRSTGAVIRCQAPLIRHVNDSVQSWTELWTEQVRLGLIPYYMFVERDTGARRYFEVPLERAVNIFAESAEAVSGLALTVRGPSMSATPGKIVIHGIADVGNERVFVLQFLRARHRDWLGRPFFAKCDPQATWIDQLKPAFGASRFFYQTDRSEMRAAASTGPEEPGDREEAIL